MTTLKYRARAGRFPKDRFFEPGQMTVELLPNPEQHVLGRRIVDDIVERLVVETADDALVDDAFDGFEILDHATSGTRCLQRTADGDFQTVRMPVHAPALPFVERKRVRRFEAEVFAKFR